MKTFRFLFAITFSMMVISSIAQDKEKRYHDAMIRNITMLDTAQNSNSVQLIANNFERIAIAEANKWLPYYYSSYALTRSIYTMKDQSKIDEVLDKADRFISIADSLQPKNSEIVTVKAFVASGRIMVNPMVRGAQYGPVSGSLLEEAIQLDPSNPRPYLLKGSSAFYTPPQWGGGKDKAAKLLQTAMDKYATFKPADDLAPNWGEARTKDLLSQCKE